MDEVPAHAAFFGEDASRPENRLVQALLGLLNVDRFREWMAQRLGVPGGSVFYPPDSADGSLRPDFVVTSPSRDQVRAWIAVELGTENATRLTAYRENLDQEITSIAADEDGACRQYAERYVGLTEILHSIEELLPELSPQQAIGAEAVINLVRQKPEQVRQARDEAGKAPDPGGPGEPSDEVPKAANQGEPPDAAPASPFMDPAIARMPIMREFQEHLGDVLEFGTHRASPGRVIITKMTHGNWSLGVFAPGDTVSLMWDESMGKGRVWIQSHKLLRQYLPEARAAVNDFSSLAETLGFDLGRVKGQNPVAIPEAKLLAVVGRMAPIIRRLAASSEPDQA